MLSLDPIPLPAALPQAEPPTGRAVLRVEDLDGTLETLFAAARQLLARCGTSLERTPYLGEYRATVPLAEIGSLYLVLSVNRMPENVEARIVSDMSKAPRFDALGSGRFVSGPTATDPPRLILQLTERPPTGHGSIWPSYYFVGEVRDTADSMLIQGWLRFPSGYPGAPADPAIYAPLTFRHLAP
jgi:hypothetical protein